MTRAQIAHAKQRKSNDEPFPVGGSWFVRLDRDQLRAGSEKVREDLDALAQKHGLGY